MIVSLEWLRNYVDISLSLQDLVERLTMVGLEVEGVHQVSPSLQDVVTVRLEKVESHPRADRLHLCVVSDGSRTYRVVCGAPNLQEGSVVALALPGAQLPGGITLKETQIRGELSQGMLCSQRELALGEDASGIWVLPPQTAVGIPLSEALGMGDLVLELGVTPNRSDCLCMVGVARELSAITRTPLRYPSFDVTESGPPIDTLSSVTIEDPVGCPRYAARLVEGVTIGPSPEWLKKRLEAIGLRSINNIVDVTNYIMMELGQPLHAFDFDRLREHRIVVRRAAQGERFTTLDGVERTLFDDTLLICDGVGPVAIAGIMGGLDSEIHAGTSRVLIESAHFQPQCIRRSSKKLGLRSESSFRFERGVDPEGAIRALDRAARLMQEVGGGAVAAGRIDVYPKPFERPVLTLRVGRTNAFLGMRIEASEMADVLARIEMDVKPLESDRLQVEVPAFRPDITREVDLMEEVARLAGYDRIPVTLPEARVQAAAMDPHLRAREEVKHLLAGSGFFEVLNYAFIARDSLVRLKYDERDPELHPVPIRNPLSEEQAVMRTTLIPGLLQTARHNVDHRNEDLRIFELGKVFLPRAGEPLPTEPHRLAGLLAGRRSPTLLYGSEEEVDYADAKGAVEACLDRFYLDRVDFASKDLPPYLDPACGATIACGGRKLGCLGRLHPEVREAFDLKRDVYVFELDFDLLYELGRARPLYKSSAKFPAVARDMALIVDEGLPVQEVLDFIWGQGESLLEQAEIFDIYKNPQWGRGKKSVGYRLVYRAADRSLTDEEVNGLHGRLVAKVLGAFDATLR